MTAVTATSVNIPTPDGVADAHLAHPDDGAAHPPVLFYMDAFGLRPHLTAMAERLAAAGYTVLVPNVFYRHGRAPVVELPKRIDLRGRPKFFERLRPILQQHTPERAVADAAAYLDFLTSLPQAAAGPVGVTGYCMGATLMLRTAAAHPDRVAAGAGFHGGNLATDQPDSPHLLAPKIRAELYFGHADRDPSLPPEQVERLNAALTDAGVRFRAEVYSGAPHGYTQADTVAYHAEAAERHWTELLALFDRTLRAR